MKILGISAYYHDSASAIVIDGEVKAAIAEERLSRIKHDNSFPLLACSWCLDFCKLKLSDIDAVVFYEKPFLKFERILESTIYNAPQSFARFLKAFPGWIGGKLNMRHLIKSQLKKLTKGEPKQVLFVEHHLAHAAFGYYTSGVNDAAILVVDAVGEKATTSFMKGDDHEITILQEQNYPNSLGLLYSSFTQFLGFKVNSDEYKVMGLAPYGDAQSPQTQHFISIIEHQLVNVLPEGGIALNMMYFDFSYRQRMINPSKWEKIFGIPYRAPGSEILQPHRNLASAIQSFTNKMGVMLASELKKKIASQNLVISGGCALNCVMNGIIKETGLYKNVFVPVDPGDAGCAIGAALVVEHKMQRIMPYLGPEYDDGLIKDALVKSHLNFKQLSDEELIHHVAEFIAQGKIVGWFQGRMEFGPRALGNRSILADCRKSEMKDKINRSVKFREPFRPFAPVVCCEDAASYFGMDDSPYMMFTTNVMKSTVPAITHEDNTARPQTVSLDDNPKLYMLIKEYAKMTGIPVILNTSFNVMGEPIVCSPSDAINTFQNSGIDVLAIGNFIITKN
ncbi:MAG: carbamoyltransferase [Bacteroides heparinolyticus]|nr:carbamoyltransferase [Bacteroides heparinolyticus]